MTQRPSAAEVARTLTAGHGTASVATAFGCTAAPVLHAGLEDGQVVLLAGRRDLAAIGLDGLLLAPDEDRVVLLDIRSYAPLPDLTMIRAHLSVAGWARLARRDELADAATALADVFGPDVRSLAGTDEDSRWSDRVLLIVEVAECELHWPPGCARIDAEDYVLADADPLAGDEGPALERVTATSADRLLEMVQGLKLADTGEEDLSRATAVRPVGLDRYGLTMQCSLPMGDAGLGRLAFPVPADTLAEAEAVIADLLDQHERCRTP